MSSRVNLSLLVDHINALPNNDHLDPDLKFKILYSSPTTSTALRPIKQHFPESFFSFDVSTEELKKIAAQPQSLHEKVQAAFTNKLSVYARLLQRRTFYIPKEVLGVLLPFLYGEKLTTPMLNDIIVEVGKLMGTTTAAATATTSITTIQAAAVKSRKRAKRG